MGIDSAALRWGLNVFEGEMRLLKWLKPEKRYFESSSDWLSFFGGETAAGTTVTPDTAITSTAVLACVRVLAETVAGLPFIVYRRTASGRERDTALSTYQLMHMKPNRYQTAFEFREMLMAHCLLRGNGYALKVYNGRGEVSELVPLNPTRVTPRLQDTGEVVYEFRDRAGQLLRYADTDIFHLKGLATDGLVGVSPITYARTAVGLALAAEEFGARVFANDAKPGGILQHPGKLSDDSHKRLKESWQQAHAGLKNAHKVAILEEGMQWQRVGVSNQDTQFIESRKFQIEEIARIFRVPPHLIGHLERATFSNIEHQSLEFVQHTLLPWLRRWEQAIATRLLDETERRTHYCEFLVDGLLRGDIQSRYSAYSIGRQWGWLSADDVRKLENMEPLPDGAGQQYLVPLNMVDAATEEQVAEEPAAVRDATFLKPVLSQLVERYSDRVIRSKKSAKSQEKVIIDGLRPAVLAYLQALGDTRAEVRADEILLDFVGKWDSEGAKTVEGRVAELLSSVERGIQ